MNESSKSMKRRYHDGAFHARYLIGDGIDIGCGNDCIAKWQHAFPRITSVVPLDTANGDAQTLIGHQDRIYDFVHASHVLEHLKDPDLAVHNWLRVLKPNGYLIVVIPDEVRYERETWPSRFSGEHLHSFRMKPHSGLPCSIHAPNFFGRFNTEIERMTLVTDFFDPYDARDQTLLANPECAIEVVARKL